MPSAPLVITLMGPTASGKTDLAVALVERFAARHPLEIVSVDSALVYRDMNIGTAKPDAAILARAPHHLIDLLDPDAAYSAARFRADALACIAAIIGRGHTPLLVGGTMLYFRALTHGFNDLPGADAGLRAEIDARAARLGWPALHAELYRLDPVSAARLQPTDAQRIQRALEVCRLSGRPMSALLAAQAERLPYRLLEIALAPGDRAWLHARIDRRFRAMLDAGLVDELAALRRKYPLHAGLPSMRCVGYRQAWQYLEGEIDAETLYEKAAAASRQLAKRQLTWLRAWPDPVSLDCQRTDLVAAAAGVIEAAF